MKILLLFFSIFLLSINKYSGFSQQEIPCLICCDSTLNVTKVCLEKSEGVIIDGCRIRRDLNLSGFLIDSMTDCWNPSYLDICNIEEMIDKNYSKEIYKEMNELFQPTTLYKLSNYLRQYIGVTNNKGDKLILITFSYFPTKESFINWRSSFSYFFRIDDGGNTYFYLIIDVNSNKIKKLKFNGKA